MALGDEIELHAEIRGIVGQGEQVAARIDFDGPSGPMPFLQWFTFRDGKIAGLEVVYDPRPFLEATGRAGESGGQERTQPPVGYPRISPYLNYENTGVMVEWLKRAFGLEERQAQRRPDGSVFHAEMTLEEAVVMMGSPGGSYRNPKHLGESTQSLYVYIDDLDQHCQRARAAGAEIIEEPADQPYGDRRYGACDPEGHRWYFASRVKEPEGSA